MKKLTALENFVIIRPCPKKTVSDGGIHLLDTRRQETDVWGTVVSVGPGVLHEGKRIPIDLKIGDKVMFHPGSSVRIDWELEKEETILKEDGTPMLGLDEKEMKKGGLEEFYITKCYECFALIGD